MLTLTKPRYYDEMSKYFPDNIPVRIAEVEKEMSELRDLKKVNSLTAEDIEDVSDNYQYHLEWNYAMSELRDELLCLQYHQSLIDSAKSEEYNRLAGLQRDREKSGFGQ